MKRLFIIRHGKTQWNLEKRLQGAGANSPLLTDDLTGYEQLARYLDQYRFAKVYASPIERAMDTAKLVTLRLSQPIDGIEAVSDLAELSFGQWEGQTRDTLIASDRELFGKLSRRENDPRLAEIGVENFDNARQRYATALQQIADELGDDENALIFSHGGISQLGIKAATGNEHLLGLKNLSTSILGVKDDGMYLDVYNQTAYLDAVDLNEGNVSIL